MYRSSNQHRDSQCKPSVEHFALDFAGLQGLPTRSTDTFVLGKRWVTLPFEVKLPASLCVHEHLSGVNGLHI